MSNLPSLTRKPQTTRVAAIPGSPLVPRVLVPVVNRLVPRELGGDGVLRLCDVQWAPTFDANRWSRLRSLVVRAVQDRLHRLPSEVLDHVLPSPQAVLRSAPVDAPTRRRLAGSVVLTGPNDKPWDVRQYLNIFKFKASGLVDLLATLEVVAGPVALLGHPSRPMLVDPWRTTGSFPDRMTERQGLPPTQSVLAELARRLPMTESAAEAVLFGLGCGGEQASLADLLVLAKSNGLALPFRKVRHGGANMLITPQHAPGVSACYTAAVRSMQSWGLASVKQIVRHVRVLHQHAIDNRIATAVLSSLPRFSWLDQKSGWFWFRDRPNRLVRALGKIFSVVSRIRADDLLTAVLRSYGFRQRPGRRVIQSACAQLPGYRIDGDWVSMEQVLDRDEWLSPTELSLIEILQQTGGVASLSSLSKSARDWGISLATLRLVIRRSPVVTKARTDLVLVGSSV